MPFAEHVDPRRSFSVFNEINRVRKARENFAPSEEIKHWLEAQIISLFLEHGPVTSERQADFFYRIQFDQDNQPLIYFRQAESLGDMHVSFTEVEKDYPDVAAGWRSVVHLLTNPNSQIGTGVFWISPMKFYKQPRLEGDKASDHDVLNFFHIIERTEDEVIVHAQTINLSGPLNGEQHKQLLQWHDPWAWLPANPSEEAVVRRPVTFTVKENELVRHYSYLNKWSRSHKKFGYPMAGDEGEYVSIYQLVKSKISPYLNQFYRLFQREDNRGINELIINALHFIKTKDAERLGLDPESVWQQYLDMLRRGEVVHPLDGSLLSQFMTNSNQIWDPINDPFGLKVDWVGGNQCAKELELAGECQKCGQKKEHGKCPKCEKKK